MTRVVLGSASTGRLKVLRQAGINPLVITSGVDEDAIAASLGPDAQPHEVVCTLAQAKAEQVAASIEPNVAADCVVIGCDSMLDFDSRLCGKPQSVADARVQWQLMAGRTGHLYTGHCLIRLQRNEIIYLDNEVAVTAIHFAYPSAIELEAYLANGESLLAAGGFTIDGLGGWFIDGIDGAPSAVVGIGLPVIRSLLHRAGLSIAALWASNS
ncbi:MAG: Maf-like protein [Mycobacteriaceae bacterium]|nr:Maf-like protein [Mycobacteriaceae bacterium]